ncbi:hypothetical protein [Ralstonia pseudosolanacearum]
MRSLTSRKPKTLMACHFTFRFKLSESDADHDAIVERLDAAGCTDALVGIGVPGYVRLEFCRDGTSLENAIFETIADVKAALPSSSLIAVEPATGTCTDIAKGPPYEIREGAY